MRRIFAPAFLAIGLLLPQADLDEALRIARAPASERAAFHAPYAVTVNSGLAIDVITEFRRAVLIGEEHLRRGERIFDLSSEMQPWSRRLGIVAHVRFDPRSAYATVPPIVVAIDSAGAVAARTSSQSAFPLEVAPAQPAGHLRGADVEATFAADAISPGRHQVTVTLGGAPLGQASIDFAALK